MKKSKITEKRILIGLISLLFVVTFVHTIGILKVTENVELSKSAAGAQKAQAFLPTASNPCLSFVPITNTMSVNGNNPDITLYYNLYYNIKNNCSYGIRILDPFTLTGQASVPSMTNVVSKFQVNDAQLNPVDVTSLNSYGLQLSLERLLCDNCSALGFVPSAVGGTVNSMTPSVGLYSLPAGATKRFNYWVGLSTDSYTQFVRVSPKAIKWVKDSDLSDFNVTASEIKTFNMSSAFSNSLAGDYLGTNL